MWTERPRPYADGNVVTGIAGLIVCAIVIVWGRTSEKPHPEPQPQCQEVVANSASRGYILAQCPPGTYVDIVNDKYVVCRCGRREPTFTFGPDAEASPEPDMEDNKEDEPQRDQGTFL